MWPRGQSHAKKEENRPGCKYYLYGKCDRGNECTYKHDPMVKKVWHEERQRKKQEEKAAADQADADKLAADLALEEERKRVKEAEEVKEKKKKEDEAKVDDDEETRRKKERRDKVKLKRKRKRELRKAGAMEDSSPMDVDDDNSPDNTHAAKVEPAAKKHKKQATSMLKAAKTATNAKAAASKSRANSVSGHASSNFQTPPTQSQAPVQDPQLQHQIHPHQQPPPPPQQQPPFPVQQQQRSIHFQPTVPSHFSFAPNPLLQQHIPPGGQVHGHGTLGGDHPWHVQQQAQLGTEFFRHQEAVQAQSLNRSVRLNNLRNEIANIQARITSTRISHPPGTVDMNSLMAAEQDLKQKLFEATYMN